MLQFLRQYTCPTRVRGAWFLFVVLMAIGCGKAPVGSTVIPQDPPRSSLKRLGTSGVTRFLARNIRYRVDRNITLTVHDLNADLLLKDTGQPFNPSNKLGYSVMQHYSSVDVDGESLSHLMNDYVLRDPESPLRAIDIVLSADQMRLSGQMKQGLWVPFEMEGRIESTPEGQIRMTPTVIKSMGVRVDGLMNLFGIRIATLLQNMTDSGLTLKGNQILMDVGKMFPPPRLLGRVSVARVQNQLLHIEYNDGRAQPWPKLPIPDARSCIAMWGGDVVINNCITIDAKFQIMDMTPQTPMVYAADRYLDGLEAGFNIPTKDGHNISYVPDILDFDGKMPRYVPNLR